jgi:hypothetical protein
MPAFLDFVQRLLAEGVVVLREPPEMAANERERAVAALAGAYADYRLDVAGPLVTFEPATALGAAELVGWACWFLLQRREPDEEVERRLPLGDLPASAAEHLSFDLAGRFLVGAHRRATALVPDDVLTRRLAAILRRRPLTGVLSGVVAGPEVPVEFDHPGLWLLYAERLVEHASPSWVHAGAGQEVVEMVFAERGRRMPALPGL